MKEKTSNNIEPYIPIVAIGLGFWVYAIFEITLLIAIMITILLFLMLWGITYKKTGEGSE